MTDINVIRGTSETSYNSKNQRNGVSNDITRVDNNSHTQQPSSIKQRNDEEQLRKVFSALKADYSDFLTLLNQVQKDIQNNEREYSASGKDDAFASLIQKFEGK